MSENTTTLKELARGAATSNLTPPNPESELPTAEEMAAHQKKKEDNGVYQVGDTPVIISRVDKKTPLDATPAASSPIPSPIGLDMDSLETPQMNVNLSPMTPQDPNAKPEAPNAPVGKISPEMHDYLAKIMPDLDVEERVKIAEPIIDTKPAIVKSLILEMGFTKEEAETAANKQLERKIAEAYDNIKNNKPNSVAEVIIDKTESPNDLGLTLDEHQKLEKVKKIRLVVVEDTDLANITIERPAEEHKADYINSIEGSLSRYAVPMPMLGDFISFRGASMVQLVNAVNYEDASFDEIINTKASLIYEKILSGTVLHKFDSNGKNIMSYQEFINKFAYQDIDMALYAILCASSMEENSTSMTCQSCSHEWMQSYNLKSLLKMDSLPEKFKERVDDILKFKSNDIQMRRLYDDMRKATRYKSPFTSNIYDVSYPSVARAINLMKRVDPKDTVATYLSAIALYLSRILIYNPTKNSYIEITAEETNLMLDTMKSISNDDVNMLAKQIRDDLYYAPQFILPAQCPSCKRTSEIPLNVESLVFLTAQDSMIEIDT